MTYFELMKKINSVFPSTVENDYREIKSDALWRRVYELIDYIGLLKEYSDIELSEMREFITSEQEKNYRKTTAVKNNMSSDNYYNYGFDQNNYTIKQSVLKMKKNVLNSIIDKLRLRHDLVLNENDYYNSNIGSITEIEDYINPNDMRYYLKNLLTISKEDNDYYYRETNIFIDDILLNYGITSRSPELTSFYAKIGEKINAVLSLNNTYRGDVIIDAIKINESKYYELRNKAIKDLVNTLAAFLNKLLENRKKEEFTIKQNEDKYIPDNEQHSSVNIDSSIINNLINQKKADFEKDKARIEEKRILLEEIEKKWEELQELMRKYDMKSQSVIIK